MSVNHGSHDRRTDTNGANFRHDLDTANAMVNGITIAGRTYKVEPSRETVFHRPCPNCAQFGHTKQNCTNQSVCFRCGQNPSQCSHKPSDQVKYCATCNSDSHYTGQARCPKYPRNRTQTTNQQPTHIPLKVPQPKPQIAPKPSETSLFPPLPPSQGLTYASAAAPTPDATQTPTPPTEPTEKTIANPTNTTKNTSPDDRTEQLVEVVLRAAMQKMEAYIDQKLRWKTEW
ncbi:hypothetical protein ANN_26040 [Periplaneta americana]|uniref:CCHC-type domain-containing protein n=1 Tax=Periplaneta americana TaxID=6978 RepID=A0ABQ8S4U5_PERAM|nr:hypothetical protein ANN_26040 [Periplaneta americana]